jgi:integrase
MPALEVSNLKTPGLYAVGGVSGLQLQVTKTGARSWVLRVKVGNKRRDIGLGGYPTVTLAEARDKARASRALIEQGQDPVAARRAAASALLAQQARSVTFRECCRQFIAAKSAEWSNAKHAAQWTSTLDTYASSVMGEMLVSDVDQSHVLRALQPIWTTKTETATRVRGRIEQVLDWARTRGYREGENPARWGGHLDKLLPAPRKITRVEHHPAVQVGEIGKFMGALREVDGVSARALEFATLTAARSGEVLGVTWGEIDMTACLWTIPADRMKAGKEHRVPLPPPAMKVLKALAQEGEGGHKPGALVFPAPRGGQLTSMAMTQLMRRMAFTDAAGRVAVPHGMRSTFRDWAGERTGYPRDVIEMALAHTIENKVEAAYRRGDMLDKRRPVMNAWAQFCSRAEVTGGKVLALRHV